MPDLRQAELYSGLVVQLALHLGQCQIGFEIEPGLHLLPYRIAHTRLASGLVHHPLHLAAAAALRGYLLCPTWADPEYFGQLNQRSLSLVISLKKLATQVVPIGSRHSLLVAKSRHT